MTIHQRRILQILMIIIILLLVIILRLAYIQLIAAESFSKHGVNLVEESVKQRTKKFILHSGRGYFSDRNGEPLNFDYFRGLILFPFIKDNEDAIEVVSNALKIKKQYLIEAINDASEPVVLKLNQQPFKLSEKEMKQINQLKIPGVYAQYVQERAENIVPYLIGVTGENSNLVKQKYPKQVSTGQLSVHTEVGVSGLQRSFDPFLLSSGQASLSYFVDNMNQPIFGFDVKYTAPADPYHPTEVVTTIDKHLQNVIIEVLKETGITKGGAILLDAKSSDLLAYVNVPTFNSTDPFEDGMKNYLLSTISPGSIFKIVVAAAAIDHNLIASSQVFDCDKNLYGNGADPRKLGKLTFKESFAQSCNYTFTSLAAELINKDKNILTEYAKKLGLLDRVGWQGDIYRLKNVLHFPEEDIGFITKDEQDLVDPFSLAQTAIGQRNVQVTPLAIANMFATIARGGEGKQVRAATKIQYENGTTVVQFPEQLLQSKQERISPYTAMKLQQLLLLVIKNEKGTAHSLESSSYQIAGKTGTVEAGHDKRELYHLFGGYFPAESPQYVLLILDLNFEKGNAKTLKAYQKITNYLSEFHN